MTPPFTVGTEQDLGCLVPRSSPCEIDGVPPFTAPTLEQGCQLRGAREGRLTSTQGWATTVASWGGQWPGVFVTPVLSQLCQP